MNLAGYRNAQGIDLVQAAQTLRNRQRQHVTVPLSELRVDERTGHLTSVRGDIDALMTPHAAKALAVKAGAPGPWAVRNPTDIVASVYNYTLPTTPGDVVIAIERDANQVVGIMSESSFPVDPGEMVERLVTLNPGGDFPTVGWSLWDTGMNVRLTSDRTAGAEVHLGDIVQAGVDIMLRENSDRGLGERGILYRLTCTNGATSPEHAGIQRLLRKEAWRNPDARLDLMLNATTDLLIEMSTAAEALPLLSTVPLSIPEELNPDEQAGWISPITKTIAIPSRYNPGIVEALRAEEPTVYGLYNAVTRLGRDASASKERGLFEGAGFRTITRYDRLNALIPTLV